MDEKETFFLTFGQRYRHEEHPSGWVIDPDGWVEVIANTYDEAREKAFSEFGTAWAFLYSEQQLKKSYFPAGKFGSI